jgi:hypothetical protein
MSNSGNVVTDKEIIWGTPSSGDYIGQYYGSDGKLHFYNGTGGADFLNITRSTGAATFSSSVTASNSISVTAASTSVAPQFVMAQTGGNTYSAIGINRADGTGIATGEGSALVLRSGDSTNFPIQFATANNVRMTITSGGSVGIGTPSPKSYSGYVVTTIGNDGSGGVLTFRSSYNSGDGAEIYQNNSGVLFFNINSSTTLMSIASSGVGVGINAPLLTDSGRGNITINGSSQSILTFGIGGSYSGYIFSASDRLEIDAQGSRLMQFNTNGLERMRITSGGAVEMTGTVKTGAPSGGTAKPIKFGAVQAASSLTGDALQVEVDGVVYLLGIVSPP